MAIAMIMWSAAQTKAPTLAILQTIIAGVETTLAVEKLIETHPRLKSLARASARVCNKWRLSKRSPMRPTPRRRRS